MTKASSPPSDQAPSDQALSDQALSDQALMACVQAGETERFAEIVRRYQPALLRVASSRLGRRDWAEDAVQETFLAAFKSRHTYRLEYGFRTWLWTILLNQCRRWAGRRARQPSVSCWSDEAAGAEASAVERASIARGAPLPLEKLLADERSAWLDASLSRLPATQADALRLRFFGGLKFEEIAGAMRCSLSTAKNRVRGGLVRMAELIRHSESAL
ncbi:MAG TPA: RNA polymerase sigma factor [Pirellulales bacterium]|nr:RNA polymerase sigma factor [Pirellulales bacterium]